MNKLEEAQSFILSTVEKLKEKRIALWGAGGHTRALLQLFKKYKLQFAEEIVIVDSSTYNRELDGVKIYSLADNLEVLEHVEYILVSSYSFQEEIVAQLIELGYQDKVITLYNKENNKNRLFFWTIDGQIYLDSEAVPKEAKLKSIYVNQKSYQMKLLLDEAIQRRIYINGIYEPEETYFVQNYIRAGQNVFDIGANVGYYSLLFSLLVGNKGKVYSFEPSHSNLQLLQQNIGINAFSSNIHINQVGLSNEKGSKVLYSNSNSNEGQKSFAITHDTYESKELIATTTIDEFVQENKIERLDFIKCDIDGGEILAFTGAQKTLVQEDAPDILFEINPINLVKLGSSASQLQQLLIDYGYHLYKLTGRQIEKMNNIINPDSKINMIASKNAHLLF